MERIYSMGTCLCVHATNDCGNYPDSPKCVNPDVGNIIRRRDFALAAAMKAQRINNEVL